MSVQSARDLPEAIQWYEGMLLAPQHFQQLSARQEMLLHYHTIHVSPFHWGIRYLTIDSLLLFNKVFRVTEMEAVMPDGLVVHHPHAMADHLEIDLTPYTEDLKNKPLTVYLVVPPRRSSSSLVKGDLARYNSVDGAAVFDENTGESELEIPRLSPRLSLVVSETPPQKYVHFPIARVQHKNETFVLTDFIPPALAVTAQSPLATIGMLLAKRLREKAVALSDIVRSPSSATNSSLILQTKSLIASMVRGLPYLEALLSSGVAHPFTLYLALCTLAGDMASLGTGLVPPVFTPYDHNDLRLTFDQVQSFIVRMIEEGILESHTAYPFYYENGAFNIMFEEEWMNSSLCITVRRKSGMTEADLIKWVETSLIGSQSKMESMREKRILGVGRKMIERDGELVPSFGSVLLSLETDPTFVQPRELLQVINTEGRGEEQRPLEIILYVRNT